MTYSRTLILSLLGTTLLAFPTRPVEQAPERKPAATLTDGKDVVQCVAFSADGKKVVAGGDTAVRVWDVGTWNELHRFQPKVPALSAAFLGEGDRLAYGGKCRKDQVQGVTSVYLQDLAKGEVIDEAEMRGAYVRALALAPDGKRLAVATDPAVRLYAVADKGLDALKSGFLRGAGDRHVNDVAFSPDGKQLASASRDDEGFALWKVTDEGLAPDRTLHRSNTEAWSVAFTQDGNGVVAGDGFAVLLLDATRANAPPIELGRHGGGNADVRCVAVSPDGKLAASAAVSDGYAVWDLATRRRLVLLEEAGAFSVAFSPDGKWLATAGGRGLVQVWDVARLAAGK